MSDNKPLANRTPGRRCCSPPIRLSYSYYSLKLLATLGRIRNMGVNGLWQILRPAIQGASFLTLATHEGYGRAYRDYPILRIGVDVSIWIDACEYGARQGTLHSQSEGAALRAFFNRLCDLLKIPATFIFVFDGPGRPSRKRGRAVSKRPLWVTKYVQELIAAFGFYCHQAPGEAEAELAALNHHGLIDAIISDDSDVIVFGGLNTIRREYNSNDPDTITVYHSDVIEHSDDIGLDRAGLIFFALCAGNDYSSGLRGCGAAFAHALARAGYGKRLLDAIERLDGKDLRLCLADWRHSIRNELMSNSARRLPSRNPKLADAVTDEFPDLMALNLYLRPLTSFSPGQPASQTPTWIPRLPAISTLAQFCAAHFAWDDDMVLKKFRTSVWNGLTLRLFTYPLSCYHASTSLVTSPSISTQVIKIIRYIPSSNGKVATVKMKVSTSNYIANMGSRLQSRCTEGRPILIELPQPIYNACVIPIPQILYAATGASELNAHQSQQLAVDTFTSTAFVAEVELTDSDDDGEHANDVIDLTLDE